MTGSDWAQYRTPDPALRDAGLVCLGAGEQSGALPSFYRRTLDSHALVLVSRGSGRVWGADGPQRSHKVVAPSYFWVPPAVLHGYGPDIHGWDEHWILYSGATAGAPHALGLRTGPLIPMPCPVGAWARIPELREPLGLPGAAGDLAASGMAMLIMAALSTGTEEAGSAELRHLRENFAAPAVVDAAARNAGVSAYGLRKLVRAATGLTPIEYVLRLRVERAQSLLVETDWTVTRIAAEVGYSDAAYFSRLFADRAGQPPSRFREQQQRSRAGA